MQDCYFCAAKIMRLLSIELNVQVSDTTKVQ
jgi:hypothetical protein